MPRYDYECHKCRTQEERHVPIAERNLQKCACGELLVRIFVPPHIEIWKPDFWDFHGPQDRVFVKSKRQLRDECEKRGKYSPAYS